MTGTGKKQIPAGMVSELHKTDDAISCMLALLNCSEADMDRIYTIMRLSYYRGMIVESMEHAVFGRLGNTLDD